MLRSLFIKGFQSARVFQRNYFDVLSAIFFYLICNVCCLLFSLIEKGELCLSMIGFYITDFRKQMRKENYKNIKRLVIYGLIQWSARRSLNIRQVFTDLMLRNRANHHRQHVRQHATCWPVWSAETAGQPSRYVPAKIIVKISGRLEIKSPMFVANWSQPVLIYAEMSDLARRFSE